MVQAKSEILFAATDPRGVEVVCSAQCWNSHIAYNREFMRADRWKQYAREAVEEPNIIVVDPVREDRESYYRLIWNPYTEAQNYIKVVTQVEGERRAIVITSFPSDSMKESERIIWAKKH